MTLAPIQGKCPVCHQDSANTAFQAGAASRDAEIGMLLTYLEYISSGELGPKICAALAKDALAKMRKP